MYGLYGYYINPKNYLKYKILNNKIYPCLDLIYIHYLKNCSNQELYNELTGILFENLLQLHKMLILFEKETNICMKEILLNNIIGSSYRKNIIMDYESVKSIILMKRNPLFFKIK